MDVTRRDMLAFASAAGAMVAAEPLLAAAQTGAPAGPQAEIIRRLRSFAAAEIAEKGFPGMVVAVVAPGFEATFAAGLADLDRRIAAAPGQLFQIGSLTKSMTALALFVLAERGRIDLDARAQDFLPDHRLPAAPITLTQLLDHSSGLPNVLEDPALMHLPGGRLWTGFAPGSRYSYCNLGYALLGAIVERASGLSWPVALETLVLRPLGMARAVPVFRTADRAAFATGHVRFRDDVPWMPRARLAQARWFDFSHAAGSVAATGADMTRYLQFLSGLALGKGAPLFSDALAERFRTPTIDSAPAGARYGNGLHTLPVEGRACFRHTGGVPGFSSALTLDREAGVGCYASVNVGGAGNYRPTEITEYALPMLRALGSGAALPPIQTPKPAPPVRGAGRFAGTWLSLDGGSLTISERGGALFVASAGTERPLRSGGESGLVTDHPALSPYSLVFDDDRLRLGARLFGRGVAAGSPPPIPRLAPFTGSYYNPAAWGLRPSVFAIGDQLFLGNERLVEAPDGGWRIDSPGLVSERVWFEAPIEGRPQRLNVSGVLFARLHDRSL